MKDKHLREPFEKIGQLDSCEIVCDPFSGESRGFGFITYKRHEDAVKACEELNKTEIHGRTVAVEIAKRKRPRTPTPGRYLGKFKSRTRRRFSGRSRSRSDSRHRSRRHDGRSKRYDDRRGGDYKRSDNRGYKDRYNRDRERDRYDRRDRHRDDYKRKRRSISRS